MPRRMGAIFTPCDPRGAILTLMPQSVLPRGRECGVASIGYGRTSTMILQVIARGVAAVALVITVSTPTQALAQTVSVSGSIWIAGPDGTGDASYSGAIDQPPDPNSLTISGWVVDTSAQGWSGIDDVDRKSTRLNPSH